MNKFAAILIDTVSIQEYIFSSNRLKENIGASYIIDNIYRDQMKRALENIYKNQSIDVCSWEEDPDNIQIITNELVNFEIGYIGGGNALILFKEFDKAKEFIKIFTKILLEEVPGVRTSFGIIEDFDLDNFKTSISKLHEQLKKNKNRYISLVTVSKHGFTLDCPRTDEAAEFDKKDEEGNFISAVAKAKLEAAKHAKDKMIEIYLKEKGYDSNYTFTDEIDKLGQQKNSKNYIAVVHIDGNKMGEKFKECNNLAEIRKLSKKVKQAAQLSFKKLVELVIEKIEKNIISPENGFYLSNEAGKKALPFIPVLIAGDEVTFVCDGRLGIWLAENYIKEFMGHGFKACGGISIVKSKYPFYKAYLMAEGLLARSKRKSRDNNDDAYLDFFVSERGFSGEIEDLLENYYRTPNGDLHFGPYKVEISGSSYDNSSLECLKKSIKNLTKMLRNKLMILKKALFEEEEVQEIILQKLLAKGYRLPDHYRDDYKVKLWANKKTPYFDAIEAIDFYPEGLMDE